METEHPNPPISLFLYIFIFIQQFCISFYDEEDRPVTATTTGEPVEEEEDGLLPIGCVAIEEHWKSRLVELIILTTWTYGMFVF